MRITKLSPDHGHRWAATGRRLGGLSLVVVATVIGGLGVAYATGVVTCKLTTACIGGSNSGFGPGVSGIGTAGNGMTGQSTKTSGVVGHTKNKNEAMTAAGVFGEDGSDDSDNLGMNVGVLGTTNNGYFGVEGTSGTNAQGGVLGTAATGFGVVAKSALGDGLFAENTSAPGGVAYLGLPSGEGAQFFGYSANATHPALSVFGAAAGTDLFATYSYNNGGSPSESFIVQAGTADRSGTALPNGSDLQISGDLFVYGAIYVDCNAFPSVSTTDCYDVSHGSTYGPNVRGSNVRTYVAQQSMKSIEDFGEARLVEGRGYVPLERTFASTISQERSYLVFITPEGDSNGLYVSAKSLTGFAVREAKGGRSTLAFQYRIVAHPYGDPGTRMAAIASKAPPAWPPPLAPDARALEARVHHRPYPTNGSSARPSQLRGVSMPQRFTPNSVSAAPEN